MTGLTIPSHDLLDGNVYSNIVYVVKYVVYYMKAIFLAIKIDRD